MPFKALPHHSNVIEIDRAAAPLDSFKMHVRYSHWKVAGALHKLKGMTLMSEAIQGTMYSLSFFHTKTTGEAHGLNMAGLRLWKAYPAGAWLPPPSR